ncbi:unnamed protein product, partial [Closterium sp. NIES-53]
MYRYIKLLLLPTCYPSCFRRGVSGGERKRVAIGVEMVSDPKILFLDEPTSGLDSTNAFRVVRAIKSVAIQTASISVMVIHQVSLHIVLLSQHNINN